MKNNWFSSVLGTFLFSLIGFMVSWLLGIVPWVGIFLALLAQFLLGIGLGYLELPIWSRIFIAWFTLRGFLLGLDHGSYAEGYFGLNTRLNILSACFLFILGYLKGCKRATADDERDTLPDEKNEKVES